MPNIEYVKKRFQKDSTSLIEMATAIIDEHVQQGFDLTIRQLYYQFVSKGLIENNDKSYNRIKTVINNARLAGLIDWDHITDRTRYVRENNHWDSPVDIIRSAVKSFQINKWDGQEYMVEVWIEKDALVGILEAICPSLDVPYFSCRGYSSQSAMWEASQRFLGYLNSGKYPILLHLGDHDPSGIDMTRDIFERLTIFLEGDVNRKWERETWDHWVERFDDYEGASDTHTNNLLEVRRIALNWDQVQQHSPPPNPAKISDSRSVDYISKYGAESWEVDALGPGIIVGLIRDEVEAIRDEKKWQEKVKKENEHVENLEELRDRWNDVVGFLSR